MLGDHQMYVVLLINNKRKGDFKSIIISRQPPVINFLNFHFYVCFISVYSDVSTRIYRWQIYTPCRSHPKVIFFIQDKQIIFFLWTQVRCLSYTWIPIRKGTIIVQQKALEHIDFIQKKEIKTWILHDIYI